MVTQITSGVKVSVEATYQPEYSNPDNLHYMFSYKISIENQSEGTIQLVKRHWEIYDAIGEFNFVDGEGVVGEQPVLAPGESHSYVSGCNLKSELGFMEGYYEMKDENTGTKFKVKIPRFNLIATFRLN